MKSGESLTRIGVRGLPDRVGDAAEKIDDFEIDAFDPLFDSWVAIRRLREKLLPHQRLSLALGHYFLRGKDSVDRRERARIAVERMVSIGARACVLACPPSLRGPAVEHSIDLLSAEFVSGGFSPPVLDYGAVPDGVPDGRERVGDPAWIRDPREHRWREWRIHGYHPTRWIRMYSDFELERLARLAHEHRPARIVFAHSQRFVQAPDFARRFAGRNSNVEKILTSNSK